MADKRDILIRLLGEETVSKMAGRAEKGLDRFGDSLDATERDARDLDRQIGEVERDLAALAVAFARTGDAADRIDISKAMRKQQAELRKLAKAKDLLPDFAEQGKQSAIDTGLAFAKHLPMALRGAMASGPGAAIGGLVAAGMVPALSAAVAGAVVGGVGIGGVVGGIKLAAQDARVQSAAKDLADTVTSDLDDAGAHFVGPTIDAIGVVRAAWNDVADDIDGTLEASSRYVVPLARGVSEAVKELMPGVRRAAEAAGPIIREISQGLPRLGRALGDVLSDFADDADEGASAVKWLFQIIEGGIRVTGDAVHMFAQMYRAVLEVDEVALDLADHLWGWIPGMGGKIDEGKKKVAELKAALDDSGDSGEEAGNNIFDGLHKVEEGATGAASEVRSLQQLLTDFANTTLDARAANREFEQAVDDATESVKENGRTLDDGTEKGRKNQERLDALARSALNNAAAVLALTGDQEKANRATEEGRKAFLRAADAMGMEAGKAKALADRLFGIPNVNRTVSVQTKSAEAAIRRVQAGLGKINSKDIRVGVYYTSKGDLKLPGGTQLKGFAEGGPIEHLPGPRGVDSGLIKAANGENMWSAEDVAAAGGQSGVERLKAALRSGPAAPAGRTMVAGGGGGSAPSRTVLEIRSGGSRLDDLLVEILRRAINDRGGNVQAVLGGRS